MKIKADKFNFLRVRVFQRRAGGSAQATIEFTFAMVIVVLLLIGMMQVAVWSGKDLGDRRKAHEAYLTEDVHGIDQTNPTFYYSSPISAAVPSNICKQEDRDF